jgi:peptidoglycan/LPS O-acetylase OafA/YrhL
MTTLETLALDDRRSLLLDLLRGLACAMVLVYHLNSWVPVGLGQAAMELFFVLSGYLIAKSLAKSVERQGWSGVKEFAVRRIRRLMPAMVGFVIGAVLLNLWLLEVDLGQLTWASVSSVLGWYNFYWLSQQPQVIGFGGIWSLSLEEQFYVTALVLVLVVSRFSARPTVWLGTLAVLLLAWGLGWRIAAYTGLYQPPWVPYIAYLPLLRFWAFGLGVAVALWDRLRPPRVPEKSVGTVLKTLATLGVMAWLIDSVAFYDANTFMLQWLLVPVGGAALIRWAPAIDQVIADSMSAAERWPSLARRLFLNGLGGCRVFGIASYSIYLWHCLVLAAFRQEDMFGTTGMWWLMAWLSVLTGLLSWKYIELRFYSFGAVKREVGQ